MTFELGNHVIVRRLDGTVIREGIVTSRFLHYILVDEVGKKSPMSEIGGYSFDLRGIGLSYNIELVERL